MADLSNYLAAFESFTKSASRKNPSWMESLRKEAASRFVELDFPTKRDEEWKYTSVEPLIQKSFQFAFEEPLNGLAIQRIEPFCFGERNGDRLVFINGVYAKGLSCLSKDAAGMKIGSLAGALEKNPDALEPHLARYAAYQQNAFTALNTAFIHDGALVELPDGKVLEEPLHLLFISLAGEKEIVSQPRNLIIAGRNTKATLIESYLSLSADSNFTNAVTEIVLGEGAAVDHYKIQRESESAFHIATTQASLSRASRFSSSVISTGGGLARNNLNVLFNGVGAECVLNGLYLATGRQHVDNHTVIDHAKPNGTSRQLYKGVLAEKSRGVFSGKIFVRRDAQKTDAHQTNKNLLLSEEATVDTKPQLEIFADDVKCTHGAAVGQLDEEAIFYLKSRGVGEERARGLLTYGFVSEVLEKIKLGSIRAALDSLIVSKLQPELPAEVAP